jgi:hypothetical protein
LRQRLHSRTAGQNASKAKANKLRERFAPKGKIHPVVTVLNAA